jgi:hypothetical protein
MELSRQWMSLLLFACAVGAAAGFAPSHASGQTAVPAIESVRYRSAPDQVVATYHRSHPEFAEQEATPLLRIYGDRTVRVHHPAFMKQAGDYEMRLEQAEMDELMATLAGAVIGFDSQAVRLQRHQAQLAKWNAADRLEDVTIEFVADATVSHFEIDIEAYRPAGAGAEVALAGPRAAAWRALSSEAQRFSAIPALSALRAVEKKLVALSVDPRLQRTGSVP